MVTNSIECEDIFTERQLIALTIVGNIPISQVGCMRALMG